MPASQAVLLRQVTCPHCWKTFHPEEVLWIAAHADLLGDPRLGPDQPQRFLPTRFNLDGNALDAHGFECQSLACPHCHLIIPRALLEMEPMFISILGTPACGKSYYLASLTWELRQVLPARFGLSITDIDPLINQPLTANEESLFLNPRATGYQYLANLIGKTKLQGEMYDTVAFGNHLVSYPRPYLFSLRPMPSHRQYAQAQQISRILCLYDNAGEHFQPGRETSASPVTQHLGRAELLLYLFDPTQDPRFQRLLTTGSGADRGTRQDLILAEAATRIRRQLGLSQNTQHDRPLIVVLTKCDAWLHLLSDMGVRGGQLPLDAGVRGGQLPPDTDASPPWKGSAGVYGLDGDRIEQRSAEVRALLQRVCPELPQVAEGFAREVLYVPVSALGHSPKAERGGPAIRPGDIKPVWVTVPVLYGLYRWMRGLVAGLKRSSLPAPPSRSPRPNGSTRPSTRKPGR
jgi:hypothetical protein